MTINLLKHRVIDIEIESSPLPLAQWPQLTWQMRPWPSYSVSANYSWGWFLLSAQGCDRDDLVYYRARLQTAVETDVPMRKEFKRHS